MRHKLFYRWLISYIAVLALPLIFSVFLYFVAVSGVHVEIERTHRQSLSQIAAIMEKVYEAMAGISETLISSSDMVLLSSAGDAFQKNHYMAMSRAQSMMKSLGISNKAIKNIYLYFNTSNLILASNKAFLVSDSIWAGSGGIGIGERDFREVVGKGNYGRLFVTVKNDITRLFFICSKPYTRGAVPTSSVLIELDCDIVRGQLALAGIQTCMLVGNGRILSDERLPFPEAFETMDLTNNPEGGLDKELGTMILYETSPGFDVAYIRFLPKEIYAQSVGWIRVVACVYFLVCLLVGGVTAYFIARRNYNPVREILTTIRGEGIREDGDDFHVIKRSLDHLIKENRELFSRIDRQMIGVRNNILAKAVKGRHTGLRLIQEECTSIGISLPYDRFTVAAFDIEDASNLFFERHPDLDNEMIDMIFFIIANVTGDLIGERYPSFTAEVDGLQVCLSSIPRAEPDTEVVAFLTKQSTVICELLENKFGVTISVNISGVGMGAAGIAECYSQTQEIAEQRNWSGFGERIMTYGSERNRERNRVMANEAIGYIKLQEYQKAIKILRQGEIEPVKPKSLSTDELFEQVHQYILGHYTCESFSVSEVSYQFDISPSYLSQIFKKRMGIGALDYVHGLRIGRAKELLGQGVSVKDAAEQVGYYDTRPMIRAFKRLENMTPVEYKKSGTEHQGI